MSSTALRVAPRVWIGFAVAVGYLVLVVLFQASSGVPYPEWGSSGANLFRGVGVSLIVGTIALAVVVTALGWWRPVLRDRHRSKHRWPVLVPALMAVMAIMILLSTDWGAYDGAFLGASLILLLVGFTEEIATRGVLLVALRSRFAEVWVWLITTSVFALMHGSNMLLGQSDAETVLQVAFTFLAGTVLYIARRVTGSLIPAMILHAAWDFANFATGVGTPADSAALATGLLPLLGLFALVSVAFVIRGADERLLGTSSFKAPRLS
ncbi:CPBP family intramembrane glutamic endopeptidase [Arthrobacter sp. GMC3]|uniref:CPBP family intramembrane glutamic endopeptidase n=1 Tax=Arthrobacter sp. GMC3 TaxID=2058894 RepID=UPI000CE45452|nr:CPBP family intramembrane glutamic endopeptidase [Arthrobacter sp. GMC3]